MIGVDGIQAIGVARIPLPAPPIHLQSHRHMAVGLDPAQHLPGPPDHGRAASMP